MKKMLYKYIIPYVGLIVVKLLSRTYRIRVIHPEIEQAIFELGEVPIYISWHQRFFPGITFFAKRHRISIMIRGKVWAATNSRRSALPFRTGSTSCIRRRTVTGTSEAPSGPALSIRIPGGSQAHLPII